jgi:hypothetical protein
VPPPVRDMALKAAEGRGMTVGDWVAEAIVSFARRAAQERPRSQLPATDPPPDLADLVHRLDQRLARLEAREQRGFFGRLFG